MHVKIFCKRIKRHYYLIRFRSSARFGRKENTFDVSSSFAFWNGEISLRKSFTTHSLTFSSVTFTFGI